jgi:ABC-type hemin transport system ATPase subunit
MLLDEPTIDLDLHHQITTLNQVESLKNRGVTIVSTMHDITLSAMYAERIIVMREGKVLLDGPASKVIHSNELKMAFDHGISVHTLDDGHTVIVANKTRNELI